MNATDAAISAGIERGALARLTAAKAVANTALRWIPPFLPTLERAFGASTTQLTTVIGLGEMAGLTTVAVGGRLDRGQERRVMTAGLAAIAASSAIALIGTLVSFAVAFVLLILGVANFTVAGHAWISRQVDYRQRARAIGVFETSWAFALLVGAPIVAIVINLFGWRGPFVVLAVALTVAAVVVAVTTPDPAPTAIPAGPARTAGIRAIPLHAWCTLLGPAFLAMAGLGVFVVSGSWLDDAFGVSTGGLGAVAMGFGAVELVASSGSAGFADRLGKLRSTIVGILVMSGGLAVMAVAGDSLLLGVLALLLFLFGFEYGFVTSLSLISEAVPDARGSTLAVGNGVGTLARGTGTIASGALYGAHGIGGTIALASAAAALSVVCLLVGRTLRRRVESARRTESTQRADA